MNKLQIHTMSKLGQTSSFFGIALLELAKEREHIYAVTADLCGYSGMDRFAKKYPDRVINVGIQEQSMISVASGLALNGGIVYAGSYASFAVLRAMEQVRHNLSVLHTNVKLVGYSAGYTMESLGRSHWATEDIAMTRCLPGMTVVSPADALEAVKACKAVADIEGPCYIRLSGKANCPIVYEEDYDFIVGKAITLRQGKDIAIVATGRMVYECQKACEMLEQQAGIKAELINMHTIKPLDRQIVAQLAKRYQYVVTVEEHNVIGGLGSAIAEYLAELGSATRLVRMGMQDQYYQLGKEAYIWQQAELTSEQIKNKIITLLA